MRWPWDKPEKRGFTDAITQAIIANAANTAASAYLGALEIAAGQLSRAFASATVTGPNAAAFTPDVLGCIGRNLVEAGESVWLRRGQDLLFVNTYERRRDSEYVLTIGERTTVAAPSSVVAVRWNIDQDTGLGLAPLATARTLRTLVQRLEQSMADESSAATGYLLPVPSDGNAGNVSTLKSDIADLKGRIAIVETTRGGWDGGVSASPRRDYELQRLGPRIPDGNVQLFEKAQEAVLAACGYPVQLMQNADGTGQREAWRRYLHGTVAPLGHVLVGAASVARLNVRVRWDELFASDVQGRARAFQSLTNGGMSVADAARAAGLSNDGQ